MQNLGRSILGKRKFIGCNYFVTTMKFIGYNLTLTTAVKLHSKSRPTFSVTNEDHCCDHHIMDWDCIFQESFVLSEKNRIIHDQVVIAE